MPAPSPATRAEEPRAPAALPPEETFWRRYSPHHEFPVSTVLTASVYALAAIVLFLVAKSVWGLAAKADPLPVSIVDVAGGDPAPDATGGTPGDLPPGVPRPDAIEGPATPTPRPTPKATPLDTPKPPTVPGLPEQPLGPLEIPNLPKDLGNLPDRANEALRKSLGPRADGRAGGGGTRGPGRPNGPGGAGQGGVINPRPKRMQRWQLNFHVNSAEEHLKQFAALGAILAVPQPDGTFQVFRDLKPRPLQGRVEDVSKLNRIWFHDTYTEHPQAVAQLGRALLGPGSRPPAAIIAFFPQALEERMTKMEEELRGKPENQIADREKIAFDVVPKGGGFEVVVATVQPR